MNIEQILAKAPIVAQIRAAQEVAWINPGVCPFDEIKEALTVGVESAIRKDMESMLEEITEKQNKLEKLNRNVA